MLEGNRFEELQCTNGCWLLLGQIVLNSFIGRNKLKSLVALTIKNLGYKNLDQTIYEVSISGEQAQESLEAAISSQQFLTSISKFVYIICFKP